tara:strand:- start:1600 stop:1947 length:348 start_codon:yes stop_codon:yes gene_type:complete
MNEQAKQIHEIISSLADQFDMNKTPPKQKEVVVEHDIDLIEDAMDFEEIIADTYIYIWKRVEDELYKHVEEPTQEMIDAIAELFVVEKTPRSFDEIFEGTNDQLESLNIRGDKNA